MSADRKKRFLAYVKDILGGTVFRNGKYVAELEKTFAKRHGYRHGIAVSSGGAGIEALLYYYRVRGYRNVVVPAVSFSADYTIPSELGYNVVVVDTLKDKPLIDPDKVRKAVLYYGRSVVIAIPYFGYVDREWVKALLEVKEENPGMEIIWDTAHCYGVELGRYGIDPAVISMYTTKISSGDNAGMVLTDNMMLRDKLLLIRRYGIDGDGRTVYVGNNFGLSEFSAAFILAGMDDAEKRIESGRAGYDVIKDELPVYPENATDDYNYYVVAVRVNDRKEAEKALIENGIEPWTHYVPDTVDREKVRVLLRVFVFPGKTVNAHRFVEQNVFLSPGILYEYRVLEKVVDILRPYARW